MANKTLRINEFIEQAHKDGFKVNKRQVTAWEIKKDLKAVRKAGSPVHFVYDKALVKEYYELAKAWGKKAGKTKKKNAKRKKKKVNGQQLFTIDQALAINSEANHFDLETKDYVALLGRARAEGLI